MKYTNCSFKNQSNCSTYANFQYNNQEKKYFEYIIIKLVKALQNITQIG